MLELLNDVSAPTNENAWEYKPVNFYPKNPADSSACFCNILLNDDVLKTEDGEFFEENTIVEFRYDLNKVGLTDDNAWKWIPIRNRHDKTTELRNAIRDKLNGKPSRAFSSCLPDTLHVSSRLRNRHVILQSDLVLHRLL
jgi:hypothetical protein